MSNDIEFVEDKTFLSALPEEKIPEKSIEGWFYKSFPGSVALKRFILLLLVIVLFIASAIFFLLSRPDPVDTVRSVGFENIIDIL
jgi:hypothetical protein